MNKISVIIPAYNCALTISKCINSVFESNKAEIECIVVVNNSKDDTLDICNKLAQKNQNIIVIESEAGNVSQARNDGLVAATGDFITFIDADDYYERSALDLMAEQLIESKADILCGSFFRVNWNGTFISSHFNDEGMKKIETVRTDLLNNPDFLGCVWNKIYRREILDGIFFDATLTHCEDTEFNFRVLKEDTRVFYSGTAFYNYVQNANSASNDPGKCFDLNNKLKYLYAMEKIKIQFEDNKKMLEEIGYKTATLCIDNYSDKLSEKIKNNLAVEIKANMKYLLKKAFKYEPAENRRRIRKGLKILLGK